jgi:2-succinyl-5-enolpyruvyl-6-hydroxy-3-cyclohexene-1-carboxylate synthase
VWRVSEDGEIRDTFRKLRYVFEMPERNFFEYYSKGEPSQPDSYITQLSTQIKELKESIPELPFSNIWIASQIAHRIPEGSTIYLGILNSLRSMELL